MGPALAESKAEQIICGVNSGTFTAAKVARELTMSSPGIGGQRRARFMAVPLPPSHSPWHLHANRRTLGNANARTPDRHERGVQSP